MRKDHLLAGEFGAAARLSPKALRLYARQGLLVPASLDTSTGYRYYAAGQLPRARLIARLRRLGLPLARIGRLADLPPEERMVELRGWLRAQRDLLDDRAALVEAVDRYVADGALIAAVAVREVAAAKVLCRSRLVSSAALPDLIETAESDIRAHLRGSGLPGDGAMRVHFQDLVTPDCRGVVEVAVVYDGSVEPVADLHIRLAPAGTEAYLPVPDGYRDFPLILHAYDAVEAWVEARADVSGVGHPYEVVPGAGEPFDVVYPICFR